MKKFLFCECPSMTDDFGDGKSTVFFSFTDEEYWKQNFCINDCPDDEELLDILMPHGFYPEMEGFLSYTNGVLKTKEEILSEGIRLLEEKGLERSQEMYELCNSQPL